MEKKKFQLDKYIHEKRRKYIILIITTVILFFLILVSLLIGQYGVSTLDTAKILMGNSSLDEHTINMIRSIVINIRLPRTIIAVIVGGILSLAGVTYQCVFRNMLVSQDVLGVSNGACVGAALGIILGLSTYGIQLLSFCVGVISVIFVYILSNIVKAEKTLSLILSGVLISGLMSSILGYIKYTANQETQLPTIIYWIMGDLSSVDMQQISYIIVPVCICCILIYINKWKLNYFSYSDNEIINLGVDVAKNRILFLICSTILVSLAVSVSGAIGWIGLVIPQLVRAIVGTDNRDVIPLSIVLGSNFLLLMDIINRIISSAELPISILTGMVGTPVFVICLIIKQRKERKMIL